MAAVTDTSVLTDTDIVYTQMNYSMENSSITSSLSYILTKSEVRANSIFYAFMIPLAISGNILSLAVSVKILRHRKSSTDLLIGFLAFSDLLNIFGIHTFSIISLVAGHWVGGLYVCGVQYYMSWSCLKFSFFILVMLTVDRYIALVKPLRYRSMVTSFRIKVGIACSFLFSFGSSLITVIGYIDTIGIIKGWYICMNNWSTSSTYYITILVIYGLTYVGGLAVFTYCNIVVAIQLCRYSARTCCKSTSERDVVMTQSPTLISKRQKRERKAARIILLISLLFYIFWGPYFVTIIFTQIGRYVKQELTVTALRLLFANAFINPVIYACFNQTYRRGFLYFIKLCLYYLFCKCFTKPEDNNIFFERKSWRQEVIRGMKSQSTINNKRDSSRPTCDSLPDVILTASPQSTAADVHELGLDQDTDNILSRPNSDKTSLSLGTISEHNNNNHCYDNIACDITENINNDSINQDSYDTRL